MIQVTYMIRQSQLWLFGHVTKFSRSKPVIRVISEEISPSRRIPRGRPPVSWLQRIDGHCRKLGQLGRAHAWHSSCRDLQGWRWTWQLRPKFEHCTLLYVIYFIESQTIIKVEIEGTVKVTSSLHYKNKQCSSEHLEVLWAVYRGILKNFSNWPTLNGTKVGLFRTFIRFSF